jgi:hypothetical protein
MLVPIEQYTNYPNAIFHGMGNWWEYRGHHWYLWFPDTQLLAAFDFWPWARFFLAVRVCWEFWKWFRGRSISRVTGDGMSRFGGQKTKS